MSTVCFKVCMLAALTGVLGWSTLAAASDAPPQPSAPQYNESQYQAPQAPSGAVRPSSGAAPVTAPITAPPMAASQPSAASSPKKPGAAKDPCDDFKAHYETYIICQDRMMKIQKMIDAQKQRSSPAKSAASTPPAAAPGTAAPPSPSGAVPLAAPAAASPVNAEPSPSPSGSRAAPP